MSGAPLRHRLATAVALALAVAMTWPAVAPAATPKPFAGGIPEPSNLAFDARGRLWVTSGGNLPKPSNGVWLVPRAGARPVQVISGLYSALGLTWYRGRLYVSYVARAPSPATGFVGRVGAFWGFDGRRFTRSRRIVDGLPTGRHRVDWIVPGPGGRLYLGVGSEFDSQPSTARLAGTVVSFRPSGAGLRLEATGLRNPYGLAFIPGTSMLLISDHGRDDLGLHQPPDEVNLLDVRGPAVDFGFPG